MPVMYSVLLKMCSKAIINHHPTKLSRAVAFLWGEYKDEYYWWEIVETYKKLILTNAVLFIDIENGSTKLLRLVVGLIVSLFGLVLPVLVVQQQAKIVPGVGKILFQRDSGAIGFFGPALVAMARFHPAQVELV